MSQNTDILTPSELVLISGAGLKHADQAIFISGQRVAYMSGSKVWYCSSVAA